VRDAQLQIRGQGQRGGQGVLPVSICASPQNRSLRSQAWINKITLVLFIAWSGAAKPGG
jgi:hypothetical protein